MKFGEGFLHHEATTKANILNQQFASVFTEEDMDNLPDLGVSPTPEMNKITINTEGVQNLLQHLKTGATLACFQSDGICP
jgi:hypothetical protein